MGFHYILSPPRNVIMCLMTYMSLEFFKDDSLDKNKQRDVKYNQIFCHGINDLQNQVPNYCNAIATVIKIFPND